MFFYLSFLRQPPRSANLSTPVSITPQIANDLRTVYLEENPDIFYTWVSSLSECVGPATSLNTRKLTVWHTSSMYKPLSPSFPANAVQGQHWRLCLTTGSSKSFVIPLDGDSFGREPLPVISVPMVFDGKSKRDKEKQEQIERLYSSSNKDRTFCVREQTSFDLDKKVWDSGIGLSSWLTKLLTSTTQSNPLAVILKNMCKLERNIKVVELGAGTGIVSICLATLLASISQGRKHKIIATDLEPAMELIQHNISMNQALYPSIELTGLVLDWEDPNLPPETDSETDVIIMADVTYNTAFFLALVSTIQRLVKSSQDASSFGESPYVLLAYKERDPSERDLWTMLQEIGINLVMIDKVSGAGGEPVEIWAWCPSNPIHKI